MIKGTIICDVCGSQEDLDVVIGEDGRASCIPSHWWTRSWVYRGGKPTLDQWFCAMVCRDCQVKMMDHALKMKKARD